MSVSISPIHCTSKSNQSVKVFVPSSKRTMGSNPVQKSICVFISLPSITSIATPHCGAASWVSTLQHTSKNLVMFCKILNIGRVTQVVVLIGKMWLLACVLYTRGSKQWLNITVLQPVIHADSQHFTTIVICSQDVIYARASYPTSTRFQLPSNANIKNVFPFNSTFSITLRRKVNFVNMLSGAMYRHKVFTYTHYHI